MKENTFKHITIYQDFVNLIIAFNTFCHFYFIYFVTDIFLFRIDTSTTVIVFCLLELKCLLCFIVLSLLSQ